MPLPLSLTARLLRSPLWLAWICLLFWGQTATAANRVVVADFDGDGRRDWATLERADSSVVRVWLSSTQATSTVFSATPILGIAATDRDGDGRPELIASGAPARLQIWTKRDKGFIPLKSKRPPPGGPTRPASRQAPEHLIVACDEISAAEVPPGSSALSFALAASRPAAPPRLAVRASFTSGFPCPQTERLAPISPRPPPLAYQL